MAWQDFFKLFWYAFTKEPPEHLGGICVGPFIPDIRGCTYLPMKIYIQNQGVYGSILVIAKDEAAARKLMEGIYNYSAKDAVEEHEIEEGFVHYNLGDC